MFRTLASERVKNARKSLIVVLKVSAPLSQLEKIHHWAHEIGIWDKIIKLGKSVELTFEKIDLSQYPDRHMNENKLFLGRNAHHATWALIRIPHDLRNRAAEVVFLNEYSDGHTQNVKLFEFLALFHPFRVFKQDGSGESMRRLKYLVLYSFLQAGLVEKVFRDNLTIAKANLSQAFNIISSDHAVESGHADTIFDLHLSSPIATTQMDYSDSECIEIKPLHTMRAQDCEANQDEPGICEAMTRISPPRRSEELHIVLQEEPGTAGPSQVKTGLGNFTSAHGSNQSRRGHNECEVSEVSNELSMHKEQEQMTPVSRCNKEKKRKADGQTDLDVFKTIKKKYDDIRNQEAIIERQLAELKIQKECHNDEILKLLSGDSGEEILKWMLDYTYHPEVVSETTAQITHEGESPE